jgi:HPt (histidine-containing phosphotransfer) domain-containing protein
MTTDAREEAERQLDRIRRDFEARLDGMIEEIACAWHAARAATDQVAATKSLIARVHRLAGNAGFFGLTKISRNASELEQALERIIERPDDACVLDLDRLVRTLQMHSASSRS